MVRVTSGLLTVPRHTVAILGGGITGLSTAYYINRKFGPTVRPVILESTNRLGGCIQSIKHENNVYEVGPQTIRPFGVSGNITLDLLEELGLDGNVSFMPPSHPASRTRLIYIDKELIPIPMDLMAFVSTVRPFKESLMKTLLKEMFRPGKTGSDDSVHAFTTRRFGSHIADFLADPVIRGVCAGDARKISAKFLMPAIYELEQRYTTVVLGNFMHKKILRRKQPLDPKEIVEDLPGFDTIGSTNLARTAVKQKWNTWTLLDGLESIPQALEQENVNSGVEILKNSPVTSIIFDEEASRPKKHQIEYMDPKTNTPSRLECSHIVSAIPATQLAKVLSHSKSSPTDSALIGLLNQIQSANLTVTNLKFSDPFEGEAFGFLVPSNQKDVEGLLGAVFNTCSFPQGNDTIITVMSQGIDLDTIQKYVHTILNFDNPTFLKCSNLVNCIPQYTVGHYERLKEMRHIIKDSNLPLTLAGASYDGVSVNDCILSGRRVSEQLPSDIE